MQQLEDHQTDVICESEKELLENHTEYESELMK